MALIAGLGFGLGASAAGTAVAQWAGVWLTLRAVRPHASTHRVGWRPRPGDLAHQAAAGRNLVVRTLALRGSFTLAVAVAARLGSTDLAAWQVGMTVWTTLAFALDSLETAAQVLVAGALGAHDPHRARLAARRTLAWSLGTACVLGGVTILARGWIASTVLGAGAGTAVLAAATGSLMWAGVLQPLSGPAFAVDGILVGAGDHAYLAGTMLVSGLVLAGGAVVVLTVARDLGALWATFAGFMGVRVVLGLARVRSDRWLRLGAHLE